MAGFNKIIVVGNLTRDPELRQLPSGQAVCRMSIATNRQFRNKQTNAMMSEVCYIDVDVWGAQAENCRQYLKKGSSVLVEGCLMLDSWTDAEGNQKSKHSIVSENVVFMSSGPGGQAAPGAQAGASSNSAGATEGASFKDEPPFGEDLPF